MKSISIPGAQHRGGGDLARTVSTDREQDWPDSIEIVAKFGRKRAVYPISREMYFGLGGGSPLNGDMLMAAVERLRRGKAQAR